MVSHFCLFSVFVLSFGIDGFFIVLFICFAFIFRFLVRNWWRILLLFFVYFLFAFFVLSFGTDGVFFFFVVCFLVSFFFVFHWGMMAFLSLVVFSISILSTSLYFSSLCLNVYADISMYICIYPCVLLICL